MIGLVYLAWVPLGPQPLRAFVSSYRMNPPGAPHELVVLLNGGAEERPEWLGSELASIEHRSLVLKGPLQDLAAYGEAAARLEHERLCLLNSYSVALTEGWLGHLSRALEQPDVGIAGASASWESQAEWARGRPRDWPRHLRALRAPRRDYPRFPNPHIRTTGFVIDRERLRAMGLEGVSDKYSAYLLKSGRASITRRVQQQGLRPVVGGADGRVYDVQEWPLSATYRSGGQRNLLISDNRTRDWEEAPPRLRRRLMKDAWGAQGRS